MIKLRIQNKTKKLNLNWSGFDLGSKILQKKLLKAKEENILKDSLLTFLYSTDKTVLDRIIVGRTSLEKITQMFGGKIIAVDCSIKKE